MLYFFQLFLMGYEVTRLDDRTGKGWSIEGGGAVFTQQQLPKNFVLRSIETLEDKNSVLYARKPGYKTFKKITDEINNREGTMILNNKNDFKEYSEHGLEEELLASDGVLRLNPQNNGELPQSVVNRCEKYWSNFEVGYFTAALTGSIIPATFALPPPGPVFDFPNIIPSSFEEWVTLGVGVALSFLTAAGFVGLGKVLGRAKGQVIRRHEPKLFGSNHVPDKFARMNESLTTSELEEYDKRDLEKRLDEDFELLQDIFHFTKNAQGLSIELPGYSLLFGGKKYSPEHYSLYLLNQ